MIEPAFFGALLASRAIRGQVETMLHTGNLSARRIRAFYARMEERGLQWHETSR